MPGGRRRNFFNLKANVELHTICGRDAAGVQAARAQLGWQHATTDWREVVESPLIDIVDIVTPTSFARGNRHRRRAKNGKHVLCEKPLALNVKQCEAMLAAAQKAKVVHMVCHNYRRIPAIALAKSMMGEGALGRIYPFSRALRAGPAGRPGISARLAVAKGDQRQRRPQRHQLAHH